MKEKIIFLNIQNSLFRHCNVEKMRILNGLNVNMNFLY